MGPGGFCPRLRLRHPISQARAGSSRDFCGLSSSSPPRPGSGPTHTEAGPGEAPRGLPRRHLLELPLPGPGLLQPSCRHLCCLRSRRRGHCLQSAGMLASSRHARAQATSRRRSDPRGPCLPTSGMLASSRHARGRASPCPRGAARVCGARLHHVLIECCGCGHVGIEDLKPQIGDPEVDPPAGVEAAEVEVGQPLRFLVLISRHPLEIQIQSPLLELGRQLCQHNHQGELAGHQSAQHLRVPHGCQWHP